MSRLNFASTANANVAMIGADSNDACRVLGSVCSSFCYDRVARAFSVLLRPSPARKAPASRHFRQRPLLTNDIDERAKRRMVVAAAAVIHVEGILHVRVLFKHDAQFAARQFVGDPSF